MEDFNLELLQKFRDFKMEKFSEQERVNDDQENKFKKFISEELSQYLFSSNLELKTQVKDLQNELVFLRAEKDDQSIQYQNLLMEEEQKMECLKLRLKIEKERTRSQACEIASLRAARDEERAARDEEIMEYQKKNKELSDEVQRLKQLQDKLIYSRLKNTNDAQLCITTAGGHVSRETTKHTERTGARKINSLS